MHYTLRITQQFCIILQNYTDTIQQTQTITRNLYNGKLQFTMNKRAFREKEKYNIALDTKSFIIR